MKFNPRLKRIVANGLFLPFLNSPSFAENRFVSDGDILLEIVYTACAEDCEQDTTRVSSDGHYFSETIGIELTKSGRKRKIRLTQEKQLEPEEVAELVKLAEQPDFVNAKAEYVVKIVQDSPAFFTITYRNKGTEKKVRVANFNAGTPEERSKVPASVLKLAKWALPQSFWNDE